MGTVYAEITLRNAYDVAKARDGAISEKEIHSVTTRAMVDTGAATLVINEETCRKLDLAITGLRRATLADGAEASYGVTEPVDIHWGDRLTSCRSIVLPGADDILLGVIPLEDLDLIVDPVRQELTGAHGGEAGSLLK
jgi:clan AA aspartic protease